MRGASRGLHRARTSLWFSAPVVCQGVAYGRARHGVHVPRDLIERIARAPDQRLERTRLVETIMRCVTSRVSPASI